jgi:hypothetical protein
MKKAIFVCAAALLAFPAYAQTEGPTVADFLGRVQALIQRGEAAAGSPELQRVRDDVAAAGRALRARQQAERAVGMPPTLCLPEQAVADNELLTFLAALPTDRRSMPLVDGFADYARSKYPCARP